MTVFELRYQVPPAQFHRIKVQFGREQVHEALDEHRCLRPAGSAIRVHRGAVVEHSVDSAFDVRDVVRTRVHQAMQDGRDAGPGGREIPAQPSVNRGPEPGYLPIAGRRHLHLLDMVAALSRHLVVLATRLVPLDRDPKLHRAERRDGFVGIVRNLAPESAADLWSDHSNLVLRHFGDDRSQESGDVRILRRAPERQVAGGSDPLRDRRPRLHGIGDQPLEGDSVAHRNGGVRESGIGVSSGDSPCESYIVRDVVVKLGSAVLGSFPRVDDHVQRLIVDVDMFECVFDLVAALRDHDRDSVSYIADFVLGYRRVLRRLEVGVRNQPSARNAVQHAVRVLPREDRQDSGLA